MCKKYFSVGGGEGWCDNTVIDESIDVIHIISYFFCYLRFMSGASMRHFSLTINSTTIIKKKNRAHVIEIVYATIYCSTLRKLKWHFIVKLINFVFHAVHEYFFSYGVVDASKQSSCMKTSSIYSTVAHEDYLLLVIISIYVIN